jgi:8-oxo-dGTP diphosphatase
MIIVTCAVIRNEENQILVVQRGEATDHPFKWEFPGGKLAPEETLEDCILREVDEELSLEIIICGRLPEVEYDYGHKKIRLIPFICDTLNEMPVLSEHIDYKWIDSKDLLTIDFSEADLFVARDYLKKQKAEVLINDKTVDESDNLTIDKDLQTIINNMMSMPEAEWVAASAIENPAIFVKLYEYSFSSDKHLSFRASWTLSKVCDRYPDMIYPYLSQIVDSLAGFDNESVLFRVEAFIFPFVCQIFGRERHTGVAFRLANLVTELRDGVHIVPADGA